MTDTKEFLDGQASILVSMILAAQSKKQKDIVEKMVSVSLGTLMALGYCDGYEDSKTGIYPAIEREDLNRQLREARDMMKSKMKPK